MKITINYEGSWRNSFLDGSNNEPIDKKGRKFIGSSAALKSQKNRLKRDVTVDTVMGLLNRLIGDQRKLYQSRADENYYFKTLESKITEASFIDDKTITEELICLRNLSGNKDLSGFTGLVKDTHEAFTSAYSQPLWNLLFAPLDVVLDFIIRGIIPSEDFTPETVDALNIVDRIEEIGAMKALEPSPLWQSGIDTLSLHFPDVNYALSKSGKFGPTPFFLSALYIRLEQLQQEGYDLDSWLSVNGLIRGISKRGFTAPDFLAPFITGGEKLAIRSPYLTRDVNKGTGTVYSKLNVAHGTLEINLPIGRMEAIELRTLILNAGVATFRVGKKGLAYVSAMELPAQ